MSEPKNILIEAINEHLLNRMNDLGFRFSESQLKFKRRRGNFSQELWFTGSKNNWRSEIIEFQIQFVVTNSKYKNLLKDLGEKIYSSSSIIQGNKEHLKSWDKTKQTGFGYDFLEMNHKEIMDDIYKNLEVAGLPYFEANNSEEKIVNNTTGNEQIDFNIYIGNYKKAKELCEYSFDEFANYQNLIKRGLAILWIVGIENMNTLKEIRMVTCCDQRMPPSSALTIQPIRYQ